MVQDAQIGVPGKRALQLAEGGIGAAVIDHDDLRRQEAREPRTAEHRIDFRQQRQDVIGLVMHRNQDGKPHASPRREQG